MKLEDFFAAYPKLALAFSGGVDSAYLLYAARNAGVDVAAYYVRTQFQPEFELREAMTFADTLGVELRLISLSALSNSLICSNSAERCYHCKGLIMSAIKNQALQDGYKTIIDGTNFSDDINDRPGFKALRELGVLSPLRLCALTKNYIRLLSKSAGLNTWSKPAYACLATRIATGEIITEEKLKLIEESENYLFSLGFSDFRVRLRNGAALLQFTKSQYAQALEKMDEISYELLKHFDKVELDPIVREDAI